MFNYNKHSKTEHNPKSILIFRQEQVLVIPFFFLNSFGFCNFSWSLKKAKEEARSNKIMEYEDTEVSVDDKVQVKSFRQ